MRHLSDSPIFLLTVALLLMIGCFGDAPHDNPLDPNNSPALPGLTLKGFVFTFYQPFRAIPSATLMLEPGPRISVADQNGSFSFGQLPPGSYQLTCRAPGFMPDSLQFTLSADTTVNFNLDALPAFLDIRLQTHHVSRWFPPDDSYFLTIEVTVDDPDGVGDIRRVHYLINPIGYADTLTVNSDPSVFTAQRFSNQFPTGSIHQLIGKAFLFIVEDGPGAVVESPPQFLTRIVETIPQLLAPNDLVFVTEFPIVFQWLPVTLPFLFSFKLEISRVDFGVPSKVFTSPPIASDSTRYTFEQPLSGGDYFWVLYIVDEFGNSSRSKEGAFRIP